MTFRRRAGLIAIAAMGVAVILGWVVARITNHAFLAVLLVEGVLVYIVGLILQGVGRLQSRGKERSR
jgi:hypothetical protein